MTGESNPEIALRFLQTFWCGDVAAAAALATPGATFVFARSLANGRDYANDYVMAFTFRGGKIVEQRAYTDTLQLSRLFGP